jgi:hypothetical protein
MTTYQFWIQTAVQIAVAIGTLLLAALAIWGAWIRARWLGPKLTLRLFDPEGEKTSINGTPCRWYHLRVTNERRSALARNVRVVLVKVSRPSADGLVRPTSPHWNADLGFVTKDGIFRLTPVFVPNNLDVVLKAGERLIIEALACSDETESSPLCVELAWDGLWSDDATEMTTHLVVKEVACL